MSYEYTIKLNSTDRFNSSLNFNRKSKMVYFDIIFTVFAIFLAIYLIISKKFFDLSLSRKVLLILCCILFPVIKPITLYFKSVFNKSRTIEDEITLKFDDKMIYISSANEKITLSYASIYNVYMFKNMIVLMYDSIHGQIIPDRYTLNEKEKLFSFILDKIKMSREDLKNEKSI